MNLDSTLSQSLKAWVVGHVGYNIIYQKTSKSRDDGALKAARRREALGKTFQYYPRLQERDMPQRSLFKNRPWIYVALDEMSEYDLLAAQQLTGMDPRTSLNNDLAFGDTTKPTSTVVSPTKRKRPDHATIEDSPSKRVKPKDIKPTAKKLGIPRKLQPIRHVVNIQPAVRGDIYEFGNDDCEKPQPNQAANTKMQRSKKAPPRSEAVEVPAVDQSSPVSKPPRATKRSAHATAAAEGQGSAFLNGRVDLSTKTGRKVGRPRKPKNAMDLTRKPGRKGGRPQKEIATVGQDPTPSPIARSDRAKHREEVRDTDRATPSVRERGKGSPQKPPHPTIDHDDEGDASDADEERLQQGESDRIGEGDEREAGTEDFAKHPPSGQDEVEEDLGDSEGQESNSDSASQVDNDEGLAEEHMDLLGQHSEWDKVSETAKSVHKTKIKTKSIKELHDEIKEAKSLYERLKAIEGLDHDALKGLNEELQESLYSIEDQINDISEHNTLEKKSETIKDIYGRAIPAMVVLLERALSLRTSQPRGLRDFHALEEIIRIQDMTLRLCEKAKSWKVKPNTVNPIIKPTTSVIFPYIRDMRNKFFFPKLNVLRVREKVKANALKTAREKAARFEQSQREAEVSSQQGSQRDPRILRIRNIEEETQRRRAERNGGRQVVSVLPVARNERRDDSATSDQLLQRNGHACPHKWTEEETQELVVQLYQSRDLPGE